MWDETRVETLKLLWKSGYSATQIAVRLGGCTRNAVIGKLHRLGLTGRSQPVRLRVVPRPVRARPATRRDRVRRRRSVLTGLPLGSSLPSQPLPPEPPGTALVASILELEEHHCKFPIGSGFCGCRRVSGLPYCEAHVATAYQAPRPRRDRTNVRPALPIGPSLLALKDTEEFVNA